MKLSFDIPISIKQVSIPKKKHKVQIFILFSLCFLFSLIISLRSSCQYVEIGMRQYNGECDDSILSNGLIYKLGNLSVHASGNSIYNAISFYDTSYLVGFREDTNNLFSKYLVRSRLFDNHFELTVNKETLENAGFKKYIDSLVILDYKTIISTNKCNQELCTLEDISIYVRENGLSVPSICRNCYMLNRLIKWSEFQRLMTNSFSNFSILSTLGLMIYMRLNSDEKGLRLDESHENKLKDGLISQIHS
jgi:hypothetical protein